MDIYKKLSINMIVECIKKSKVQNESGLLLLTESYEFPSSSIRYFTYTYNSITTNLFMKTDKFGITKNSLKEKYFYEKLSTKFKWLIPTYIGSFEYGNNLSVLMLDQRNSYFSEQYGIPPLEVYYPSIAEMLADFHSVMWEHKDLDGIDEYLMDEKLIDINSTCLDSSFLTSRNETNKFLIEHFNSIINEFIFFMKGRISGPRYNAIKFLKSNLDYFLDLSTKNRTLVHGDFHPWNILYPKSRTNSLLMVDWQTWSPGVSTDDITHIINMHNSSERRDRIETLFLKRYHKCLIEKEIKFTWDEFIDLYHFSLVRKILLPILQWKSEKITANVWINNLERIFTSIEEKNIIPR